MRSPVEFIRSVVMDEELFSRFMLLTEEKLKKPTDFSTGFLMGWYLGRMYGREETDDGSNSATKNVGGRKDV